VCAVNNAAAASTKVKKLQEQFLTSEHSDDGPTGRGRIKHCQQFGNARMSASGSVHWPEGAMDGCE
jgi:hypothetical protein